MFGFMLISWFLSMWIANTAAAAMMIPIVLAVLDELERSDENDTESGIGNLLLYCYYTIDSLLILFQKILHLKKKKRHLMIWSHRLVRI